MNFFSRLNKFEWKFWISILAEVLFFSQQLAGQAGGHSLQQARYCRGLRLSSLAMHKPMAVALRLLQPLALHRDAFADNFRT